MKSYEENRTVFPFTLIDGYKAALCSIRAFSEESDKNIAILYRLDGYTEAFKDSGEIAETYLASVVAHLEGRTRLVHEILRLDEKCILILVAMQQRGTDELIKKLTNDIGEVPHYLSIAPARSRQVFASNVNAEDMLGKLFRMLPQVWEQQITQDLLPVSDKSLFDVVFKEDQIVNYMQPIFWCDGILRGFEILVRWNHPYYGLLKPFEFLEEMLSAGFGVELLKRQLQFIEEWISHCDDEVASILVLGVNIESSMFSNPSVWPLLKSMGNLNVSIELELHDDMAISKSELLGHIETLHAFGLRVALDEYSETFNSGVAVLSHFDTVKIGPALVRKIRMGDSVSRLVVSRLASLCRDKQCVVAVGVECRDHQDQLRGLGCDAFQGFSLRPPMEHGEAKEWLVRHKSSVLDNVQTHQVVSLKKEDRES